MSKELTEKFMNDELDDRLYYFTQKMSQDNVEIGHSFAFNMVRADDGVYLDWFLIHEVLAPVPSFDEYNELVQKIHLLNEANMKLENTVGKLCEQLKEANYAIKHYKYCSSGFKVDKEGSVIDKFIARSYLDKWGVK